MGASSDANKWWNTDINSMYPGREKPKWEKWFAWKPVEINGQRYWLCNVYRRHATPPPFFSYAYADHEYEYGTLFDVLKES